MELFAILKSIIDTDKAAVVVCDTDDTIIYMNPAAIARHEKSGGAALIGRSIKACHSEKSCALIDRVTAWFRESEDNNILFTYHNPKENKDVYMVALRDEQKRLIGYYEKHEYRSPETAAGYEGISLS